MSLFKKTCLAVILFFLVCIFTKNASAALVAGTYNLGTSGSWSEYHGGNEGSVGSIFSANGQNWSILGALSIAPTASSVAGWDYETKYNVAFSLVAPGPWETDNTKSLIFSNIEATNFSRLVDGKLEFSFSFTGYDPSYPTTPIYLTAWFNSIPPTNPATGVDYWSSTIAHGGTTFATVQMVVTPIPAAAWMLGAGLVGLVAIRRRTSK